MKLIRQNIKYIGFVLFLLEHMLKIIGKLLQCPDIFGILFVRYRETLQCCSEGFQQLLCSYSTQTNMILTALTGADPNSVSGAYS